MKPLAKAYQGHDHQDGDATDQEVLRVTEVLGSG